MEDIPYSIRFEERRLARKYSRTSTGSPLERSKKSAEPVPAPTSTPTTTEYLVRELEVVKQKLKDVEAELQKEIETGESLTSMLTEAQERKEFALERVRVARAREQAAVEDGARVAMQSGMHASSIRERVWELERELQAVSQQVANTQKELLQAKSGNDEHRSSFRDRKLTMELATNRRLQRLQTRLAAARRAKDERMEELQRLADEADETDRLKDEVKVMRASLELSRRKKLAHTLRSAKAVASTHIQHQNETLEYLQDMLEAKSIQLDQVQADLERASAEAEQITPEIDRINADTRETLAILREAIEKSVN